MSSPLVNIIVSKKRKPFDNPTLNRFKLINYGRECGVDTDKVGGLGCKSVDILKSALTFIWHDLVCLGKVFSL